MNRPFDFLFLLTLIPKLLPYFGITIIISLITALIGSAIALGIARAHISSNRFFSHLARVYVNALRCTPSIVLLFLVYYGLPTLVLALTGKNIHFWHRAVFVLITYILLFSATVSEVFRSAWLSVDRGQAEAAVSSGLSPLQAQLRIVLPQALTSAIPNYGNALIALLKEGALAYTIGLVDAMGQGLLIISRNYGGRSLETWLVLALFYWLLTICIERLFLTIERNFSKGKRELAS